jgi:threonine synthase
VCGPARYRPRMASLVCHACAERFALDPARWRCHCGGVVDLVGSLATTPIDLGLVATPLVRLADPALDVWVKLEGALPTGSFKDRGNAYLVGLLAEHGVDRVVADSSGNAGASLAAHCAKAGIRLDLFCPETAAAGKLVQAEAHGAHLHRVPGTRQDTAAAAQALAETGVVYATHAASPFFVEGTRSFGREVAHHAGDAAYAVVIPVGSGTLLLGTWREVNTAVPAPRLFAVQSTACAPLAAAFAAGQAEPAAVTATTSIADGVLVARPPRGGQVLQAVRISGGAVISVDDDAVAVAVRRLAGVGILAEPTAALGVAGLHALHAQGWLDAGLRVYCPITGHGLKTPELTRRLALRS